MKYLSKFVVLSTLLSVSTAFTGIAFASTIVSGISYCDIGSPSGPTQQGSGYAILTPTDAQLANAESTSAGLCATFTASGINFATGPDSTSASSSGVTGGLSLNNFLNYGGTLLSSSYSDVGASANGAQTVLANGAQDDSGNLLVLSGVASLVTGQSVTLSHDDGAEVYVCLVGAADCSLGSGGVPTVLGNYSLISPAGSNVQTVDGQSPFTFTGATGNYDYLLIYNANYLQPSALTSNINVAAEPGSLILLGTGLCGGAGLMFRRRKPISA